MKKIRVCFLGTPEFAVTSLKALLADERFEVVGVVSQPDRPAGRKLQLTPSPVKSLASEHNLPVITPESLRKDPDAVTAIRSWQADVGVVVAFGQILTEDFMAGFPHGCVNVHGSILPRWRGAAPIQRAIEAGDHESGVTLQKMVKKLDAGDIIGIRRVPLSDAITAMELHDQLAELGADLLKNELIAYVQGELLPVPQDESQVTVAPKIDKTESLIDWSLSASHISGKVRGFVYGPGTYTLLNGKKIKLHRVEVERPSKGAGTDTDTGEVRPGEVLTVAPDSVTVACGENSLRLWEVQPESKSRMAMADFLKGHPLKKGDCFGA